jgi:hypothetical protein
MVARVMFHANQPHHTIRADGAHAHGAIVDQNMQSAQLVDRICYGVFARRVGRDVRYLQEQATLALIGQEFAQCKQSALAHVERRDFRALREKGAHQDASETAGCAGNDGDLAVQPAC